MIKKYNIPNNIPPDGIVEVEKLLGFKFEIDAKTAALYNKFVDEHNKQEKKKILTIKNSNNVREIIRQIKAKAKYDKEQVRIALQSLTDKVK